MDVKERIIRGLDLFEGCSGAEIAWAMQHGDLVDVTPGVTLAAAGTYAHEFVVVVSGAASATRDGCTRVLGAGRWFGADEITADRRHEATVTALDGLRVLAFEGRAFRGFAECLPTVACKLAGIRTSVVERKATVRPRLATAS